MNRLSQKTDTKTKRFRAIYRQKSLKKNLNASRPSVVVVLVGVWVKILQTRSKRTNPLFFSISYSYHIYFDNETKLTKDETQKAEKLSFL